MIICKTVQKKLLKQTNLKLLKFLSFVLLPVKLPKTYTALYKSLVVQLLKCNLLAIEERSKPKGERQL